ncbi:hypothetical protein B9Z55_028625 [Caenorhabditis nigoni]|nr:hypothetical protein B9Z55_028625 [Caenorhabditis nigoni]
MYRQILTITLLVSFIVIANQCAATGGTTTPTTTTTATVTTSTASTTTTVATGKTCFSLLMKFSRFSNPFLLFPSRQIPICRHPLTSYIPIESGGKEERIRSGKDICALIYSYCFGSTNASLFAACATCTAAQITITTGNDGDSPPLTDETVDANGCAVITYTCERTPQVVTDVVLITYYADSETPRDVGTENGVGTANVVMNCVNGEWVKDGLVINEVECQIIT